MEKFDFNRIKGETDTLIGQRKFIQATNKLEEALEKFPGKPELYFLLGEVYQHIDIEASIRSYQKGLSFDANHVFLNISLGFLYFNRKEYGNAEKYLRTIWVEDPTNIRLLTALGKIYKAWKQYEKATKYFLIGELLEPNNSFALYGLADTYRGMGDYKNALKYWLRFHELEPRNKVALTRIGDCYARLGDFERGLDFYRKALEIGYDFYASLGSAKIHAAYNNAAQAMEVFEQMATSERGNSRYYYEYIRVCQQCGEQQRAAQLLEHAQSLFPGNTFLQSLA